MASIVLYSTDILIRNFPRWWPVLSHHLRFDRTEMKIASFDPPTKIPNNLQHYFFVAIVIRPNKIMSITAPGTHNMGLAQFNATSHLSRDPRSDMLFMCVAPNTAGRSGRITVTPQQGVIQSSRLECGSSFWRLNNADCHHATSSIFDDARRHR